jgi:hypothetical protein
MPERREGGEAVSGGIVHPGGCRCPGCLPGQYVMRQNRPAPPRTPSGNRPVYRTAPRSHAWNCPCSRCVQVRARNKGNYGIIGPGLLVIGIIALIGFWPAMVWHGYTDTGGWRWDIHSTIAELAYFGIIAGFADLLALVGRVNRMAAAPQKPRQVPAAPPACVHLGDRLEPVNNIVTGDLEAWLCLDCGGQLDPGFRPAAPGAAPVPPALRWQWEWWCSCGARDAGIAATGETARARARGATRHVRRGCQWEMRWHAA